MWQVKWYRLLAASLYCGEGVNAASDGAFAKITSSMRKAASRKTIAAVSMKVNKDQTPAGYLSFSYSASACFKTGMSGSGGVFPEGVGRWCLLAARYRSLCWHLTGPDSHLGITIQCTRGDR